jgi:hypothetical protein
MPEWALKMKENIKESLRKAHPSWGEEKISSVAYGAVVNQAKSEGKSSPWTKD